VIHEERILQIDVEVKKLRSNIRELLKERRSLVRSEYTGSAKTWRNEIITILDCYPGASRQNIVDGLSSYISSKMLTNVLTTLRRHGEIENRGTKKNPQWYIKETPN
jgi:hypothetical protein